MKTNTFSEKLYALADDFSNIEMNARFHNSDWLVHSIEDLVLNDVIGSERHLFFSKEIPSFTNLEEYMEHVVKIRNTLRDEQRAIVKGGNHED